MEPAKGLGSADFERTGAHGLAAARMAPHRRGNWQIRTGWLETQPGVRTVLRVMEPRSLKDADLVARARTGDVSAFEALLAPLVGPGHRLAVGLLQDPQLAEDCVQESCLRAWRRLDQLRPGNPLRPWFFAIVVNQCRDQQRGHWWRLQPAHDPIAWSEGPEDEAVRRADLRAALRKLNFRDRQVVVLRLYADLSWAEVASLTRLTEAGARTRMYRALHKLRLDQPGEVLT
jgi:RNA polymerase sigma factor (sigma-70 family)